MTAAKAALLAELSIRAEACRLCPLGYTRTQAVFGVGNPDASVMFVGEAPGMNEDLQGEPFVGRAGKLLDSLIMQKLHLTRADIYIANVIKCRPPGNRNPVDSEVSSCRPFLERQIEIVDPKIIVTMGNFATKLLLDTTTGISRLRGQVFDREGRRLMPTYHPAAALRGTNTLAAITEDFEKIAEVVGIALQS